MNTESNSGEQQKKEVVKPWPLVGYAPGNYMNTCGSCGKQMEWVDKLCFMCLECAVIETQRIVVRECNENRKVCEGFSAVVIIKDVLHFFDVFPDAVVLVDVGICEAGMDIPHDYDAGAACCAIAYRE